LYGALSSALGYYEPFDVVTKKSFAHAAVEAGYDVPEATNSAVCEAYWKLGA